MMDEVEKLIAQIEKDGVGSVMTGLRSDNAASNIPIQAALAEYERRQQLTRDEELRKLATETLEAQRSGNKTQREILKVLVLTIAVTIVLAIFNL